MNGLQIALYMVLAMVAVVALRVMFGPTVWDRLLGLNLIALRTVRKYREKY